MKTIFFHIDVNSAFLSWSAIEKLEQGDTLDLRTIPAIIGGDSSKRHGIVLAKSIPAKSFGICTGEPVRDALKKCPSLKVVPPDHELYHQKSHLLMQYLKTICPDIEQVSVDECYMNYTPIYHLYGDPVSAANHIKNSVHELFGFTVNIGISDRKVLAKMASDFQKPDLVHTLFQKEIQKKMWPLPISELYMCGSSSVEVLRNLGILTIGELATSDPAIIRSHLKSHGILLWQFANGEDTSQVITSQSDAKGIGNSTTLAQDALTLEDINTSLLQLAESVSTRLRNSGQRASMISVELKYNTFQSFSHQMTLSASTNTCNEIYLKSCELAAEIWNGSPVRLLGIRTSKLCSTNAPVQMSIFDLTNACQLTDKPDTLSHSVPKKQQKLENALDEIRKKYGENAIVRGTLLHPPKR